MNNYNPHYQPHLPEEVKAYLHGQVFMLLRIKAAINTLKEKAQNKDAEDYGGFHIALFNMERALKLTLDELDVELEPHK